MFGFQWTDREGKTPLIVACMNPQLYDVAKTLIELGANVNAYRPGKELSAYSIANIELANSAILYVFNVHLDVGGCDW